MDIIEKFFRLIVGKSRIAYRKDVIRHLEELKGYYDKRGFWNDAKKLWFFKFQRNL